MAGPVATQGKSAGEKPGGIRPWLIWGVASLFYLYEFFIRAAPSVMEPELQSTFHLSAGALAAMVGLYFYIYAPMQLVVGPILDRISTKYVLVCAVSICVLGSFLEAGGAEGWQLGLARSFQGFGSAFAFVGTMYLAVQWFPSSKLALLAGLTTALGMIGAIAAEAGIANVVEKLGWQSALQGAGFVGIAIGILIFLVVPHRGPRNAEPSGAAADDEAKVPGLLQSLWMVIRNIHVWLAGIVAAALYMPLTVLGALWGVQYIHVISGEDKIEAAGATSMLYVGWLVGGPIVGWISDRIGRRQILLFASSVLTLLSTMLLLMFTQTSLPMVYALMLFIGIASSAQVVSFVLGVEHSPIRLSGTAIAVINMFVMLIGGLGQTLFGVILDWATGPGPLDVTAEYSANAYRTAMLIMPAAAAIGIVCSLILRDAQRPELEPPG